METPHGVCISGCVLIMCIIGKLIDTSSVSYSTIYFRDQHGGSDFGNSRTVVHQFTFVPSKVN